MFRIIKRKFKTFWNTKIKKISPMDQRINNWRCAGIKIGKNCHIYSSLQTTRDAFLLEIGDDVCISVNVSIFCHDASIGNMTRNEYTDSLGKVVIGNNCFIGWGSIILPGVTLADGVVVGAGSVVTKSCFQSNAVIAGNPARIIGTTSAFLENHNNKLVNLDGLESKDIKKLISENPDLLIERKGM